MTTMVGPFTGATPAREHVRDVLMPYGLGCPRIAELAGVPGFREWDVWVLVNGRPDHNQPPPAVIPAAIASAVRAIDPVPAALAGGVTVDGLGFRRRMQALAAAGWSAAALAARLPCEPVHLRLLLSGKRTTVSAALDRRGAALYARLLTAQPPQETGAQRAAMVKSQRWAQRNGWWPAGAWDEGEIGDPDARPHPEWLRGPAPAAYGQARCGTPGGYSRHRRRGEEPCEACKASRRKPRELSPCGTPGAAKRHWRNDEECEECRAAERRRVQDAGRRRREQEQAGEVAA